MIRLVQRKLIIPRGDTGSFNIPIIAASASQIDVAVFTIFDCITHTKMFQKTAQPNGEILTFTFTHNDTVNLMPGRYVWDVKFYQNPQYADGELVGGDEIDSYYAGFKLPECEIRETGDDLLVSPDAPSGKLTPEQLDIISAALTEVAEAVEETKANVAHYPYVSEENYHWYVWDAENGEFVDTGVDATGEGVPEGGTTGQILKKASNANYDTEWADDIYATKADTVLDTTLSRGRAEGSTIGNGSFAFGDSVIASGVTSHAEGTYTKAKGQVSHAEGNNTYVSGSMSHAEGSNVYIRGNTSHAEGSKVVAYGHFSHVEGSGIDTKTIVISPTNIAKTYTIITNSNPVLTVNQIIFIASNGAFAKVNSIDGNTFVTDFTLGAIGDNTTAIVFIGGTVHPQSHIEGVATMTSGNSQHVQGKYNAHNIPDASNYADIVGNGTADDARSNAFALTWEGDGKYAGDVYVGCNADSSGGTKLAKITDIPSVPVSDVQINGTSILSSGVANIPIASDSTFGVVKTNVSHGIGISNASGSLGELILNTATSTDIKTGTNMFKPLTAKYQHESAFYGLAKAAGDVTQAASANAVGTYTDDAKAAIRTMLDVPSTSDIPESSVADVQIDEFSIVDAYGIANIPLANEGSKGVVAINNQYGIGITDGGDLETIAAESEDIQYGTDEYEPIVPYHQHESVFYGLAKAAGDNTMEETDPEEYPVGTYTDGAKSAIRTMIGAGTPIDVQINSSSIVNNGVANIPYATSSTPGVVIVNSTYSPLTQWTNQIDGKTYLVLNLGNANEVKEGNSVTKPSSIARQHEATFYGLAKAAGDSTQSASNNAVGTYTSTAKNAIHQMLGTADLIEVGFVEEVSGTSPTITGQANYRYICGEVTSISITPPSAGSIDVLFTSGSSVAVLTVPNTVKWPVWFDPTSLDTDTIYELLITDGVYGSVMTWAAT